MIGILSSKKRSNPATLSQRLGRPRAQNPQDFAK
jgi:hypothetical protein